MIKNTLLINKLFEILNYSFVLFIPRKKGPIDLKGKNTTEQKWLIRQLKDPFVKKARQEDYRCRSCFKLLEIQERFKSLILFFFVYSILQHCKQIKLILLLIENSFRYNLLKEGQVVIDVGAAPGSWTQVAVELVLPHLHSSLDPNNTSQTSKIYRTNGEIKIPTFSSIGIDRPILSTTSSKGLVLGIDLQDIQPLQGATFLCNSDITHATTQQNVLKILNGRRADVVLSDVAPQATGVKDLDSDASQELIFNILKFSIQILKQDGHLLIKVSFIHTNLYYSIN